MFSPPQLPLQVSCGRRELELLVTEWLAAQHKAPSRQRPQKPPLLLRGGRPPVLPGTHPGREEGLQPRAATGRAGRGLPLVLSGTVRTGSLSPRTHRGGPC